jgi:hypothetical protein
MLAQAAAKN